MEEEDRWKFLVEPDEELLKGGVLLSEWCSFIVRETDTAFTTGAHLATIITAMAGIETYLRSEYSYGGKDTLHELIERSPLEDKLKGDLHNLRRYRNRWVHLADPWDDQGLLDHPEQYERDLENMAMVAVRALRRTIYENPWI
jgi:hypothetical protein